MKNIFTLLLATVSVSAFAYGGQQSFRQLYDLFDSQASRDELDNYIRAKDNSQD